MLTYQKIYLSFLGPVISIVQNLLSTLHKPFMVYGYYDWRKGLFMKHTRISSSAKISCKKNLDMADHVWISHYAIIDASAGVKLGKGVQLGAWAGIFTHSAHMSVRLLGDHYIKLPVEERVGYIRGKVEIGEFSCIGASSLVLPGVKIGKGCIVSGGSLIRRNIPDYSIVGGNPAKIIGDTRKIDKGYFGNETIKKYYYDKNQIQSG